MAKRRGSAGLCTTLHRYPRYLRCAAVVTGHASTADAAADASALSGLDLMPSISRPDCAAACTAVGAAKLSLRLSCGVVLTSSSWFSAGVGDAAFVANESRRIAPNIELLSTAWRVAKAGAAPMDAIASLSTSA